MVKSSTVIKEKSFREKSNSKSPKAQKSKIREKVAAPVVPEPSEEKEIISKFQVNDADTGSPEVQVALLSEELRNLFHT